MSVYHPSLEELRVLSARGNLAPVYREVAADLETPVSAFLKVATGGYSFLLESVEGGERQARYSFIGTAPHRVLRTGPGLNSQGDPLKAVEDELGPFKMVSLPGLPRFTGGAVGYLAYETARHFERLPAPAADPLGMPESLLLFVDTILIFDHLKHTIKVVTHAQIDGDIEAAYRQAVERIDRLVERLNGPVPPVPHLEVVENPSVGAPVQCNMTRQEFMSKVERAREYIVAGDVIQAVPSLRLSRATAAHPFQVYRALRMINPSPYMYYLRLDDSHIVGASPELLVQVEEGRVATHPIAGTRPRGRDAAEDAAYEEELKLDDKERAEHVMLVDLGRNDIGRVSQPGTVKVTQLMDVERYSHVMHLVSHVIGRLRPDLSQFDALRACFPAGTVTGAPKVRAMEIIAELEPHQRGLYAGAVGYFSYSGNLDMAIAIRTMVFKQGVAHVQAGAGIVYDSVPEKEYQECVNKAQALMSAIDQAEAELGSMSRASLGY